MSKSQLNKTLPLSIDEIVVPNRNKTVQKLPSLMSKDKWVESGMSYSLNTTLAQAISFKLSGRQILNNDNGNRSGRRGLKQQQVQQGRMQRVGSPPDKEGGETTKVKQQPHPLKSKLLGAGEDPGHSVGRVSKSTIGVGSSSMLLALDSTDPLSDIALRMMVPEKPTLTPGQLAELIPVLLGDSSKQQTPRMVFERVKVHFDEVCMLVQMSFEEVFFLNNFGDILTILAVAANNIRHLRFELDESFNQPRASGIPNTAEFLYREVYRVGDQQEQLVVKERQSTFLKRVFVFFLQALETFVANPSLNYTTLVNQLSQIIMSCINEHEDLCRLLILGMSEFWHRSYEFWYLLDDQDSSQLTLVYLQLVKKYLKTTLQFLEGESTVYFEKLSSTEFVLSDTLNLLLLPSKVSSYYKYPQLCQTWKEVNKLVSQLVSLTPGLVRAPNDLKFLMLDLFGCHMILASRPALTGFGLPTQDCLMFMLDLVLHHLAQDMQQLDISHFGRMLIYLKKCIEHDNASLEDHFHEMDYKDLSEFEKEHAHVTHTREAANLQFLFVLDIDMLKHILVTLQKYCRIALETKHSKSQGPMAFVFGLVDVLSLYFSIRVERGVPHNIEGLQDLEHHLGRFKKQLVQSHHYLTFPDISQKLSIKMSALSLLFKIGIP